MDIGKIQEQVGKNEYVYTDHADTERRIESLTLAQIETAILNAEVLEQYPDTGRGESCLIVGFANEVPIHVVWLAGREGGSHHGLRSAGSALFGSVDARTN